MKRLGLNARCPNPPNRHYVGLSVDSAKMLDLDRLGMNFNVTHKGQVRVTLLYMDVGVEVAKQKLPSAHADPALRHLPLPTIAMYPVHPFSLAQSFKLRLPFSKPAEDRKGIKEAIVEMTRASAAARAASS